ncbi:MAG: PHP domain-containing protein [Myxococcales bacterium]|nr:MAG: PHP domain-containing protein [Myxococcales bacterium]
MASVDLHTHSTASDGSLTPGELVDYAYEAGVVALALTDHDTIDGLREAEAEARRLKMEFIPGVELSMTTAGGSVHVLGYSFDPASPDLQAALRRFAVRRYERNLKIIERFAGLGVRITEEDLARQAGGPERLMNAGRPHFARLLIEQRLVGNFEEAFERYLGKGKPAYAPKSKLDPEEGIAVIHAARGVAVLAHPKYSGTQNREELATLVEQLVQAGLDGLECHYTDHTPEETAFYQELARRHALAVTGGTDFHGSSTPETRLGRGRDNLALSYDLVDNLRAAHYRRYG